MPQNFSLAFLVGAAFAALGVLSACFYAETPQQAAYERRGLVDYLRGLARQIGADQNFVRYVTAKAVAGLGFMGPALFTAYATKQFQLPAETAATFGLLYAIPSAATSLLWGWIGERGGYLKLSIISAAIWAAASALGVAAPVWPIFAPALVLAGVAAAMDGVATNNIIVESGREGHRLGYIAGANTVITLPFAISPPLGGWLAERLSFGPVFCLAALLYLAAAALMLFRVRDPRQAALP